MEQLKLWGLEYNPRLKEYIYKISGVAVKQLVLVDPNEPEKGWNLIKAPYIIETGAKDIDRLVSDD